MGKKKNKGIIDIPAPDEGVVEAVVDALLVSGQYARVYESSVLMAQAGLIHEDCQPELDLITAKLGVAAGLGDMTLDETTQIVATNPAWAISFGYIWGRLDQAYNEGLSE